MSKKNTSMRLFSWVVFAFVCAGLFTAYNMYSKDITKATTSDAEMAALIEDEITLSLNDMPPMPEVQHTESSIQLALTEEDSIEAEIASGLNTIEPTMGTPTVSEENAAEEAVEENVVEETVAGESVEGIVKKEIDAEPVETTHQYVRAIGNPDAPVKIAEYSALTCGHCAKFHMTTLPKIKEKYVDTGKVYMTFTPFPLNARDMEGAQIMTCMDESRHYDFMNLLFETAGQWAFGKDTKNALKQNAKLAGMSDEAFEACLKNKDIIESLALGIKDAASEYKVNSTPTFVFNDGEDIIVGAAQLSRFDNVIEALLKKTADADSEK